MDGQKHPASGDCKNAIGEIAIAYRVLVDDVTRRTGKGFGGNRRWKSSS
jgi:hypothetical protein